ncbi:MAG TPA: TIGR01777 family oxidoreductase [Chthoniobacterales bacterium]|nr:TIGR01777 family oxidoreductase [Chthoniobacterales bacterium]
MKLSVVLAGGSGFLGQSLAKVLLGKGYEVVILSRGAHREGSGIRQLHWDDKTLGDWSQSIDGAKAIVNLTGRSVNCRHTPEHRREIMESRVNSVRVLSEAVSRCAQPPEVWVQASSLAIYGDPGDRWCDENAPQADGFSEEVCKRWEGEFAKIQSHGMRKVVMRIGIVLDAENGALPVLARLTRFLLGGRVGNGRQYVSWLHVADLTRMFVEAIERPDISGVYNVTGPNPVTNAEFMRELRRALHRPWSPPVPAWATHIGAFFMRTEPSLALTGRRCRPKRFLESGFHFEFPELRGALDDLYR